MDTIEKRLERWGQQRTKRSYPSVTEKRRAPIPRGKKRAPRPRPRKPKEGRNIVCISGAGTGKTFTLMGLIQVLFRLLPKEVEPNPQQSAIWEEVQRSKQPKYITAIAFNNAIVDEFKSKYLWLVQRLQRLGVNLRFSTTHALGNGVCYKAYGQAMVNKWRTMDMLEAKVGKDTKAIDEDHGEGTARAIDELVHYCKVTLAGYDRDNRKFDVDSIYTDTLDSLVAHYGIDIDGSEDFVYLQALEILEQSRTVEGVLSFDDMIWLPIVNRLKVFQSSLLIVDEAQDLNRCQHELAISAGDRIIAAGDSNQAIYGFAGADIDSIPRFVGYLDQSKRGVVELPLSVTYRCAKEIVNEANRKWLPEPRSEEFKYKAHQDNPRGEVGRIPREKLTEALESSDMVLSRINAPLIGLCFRLLRERKKAYVQGREIGEGLIGFARKLLGIKEKARLVTSGNSVDTLLYRLEEYHEAESRRIGQRKRPAEEAQAALDDKRDCILAFADVAVTLEDFQRDIENLFTDDTREGIRLSSCHKAKGLESQRVYLIRPDLVPHPMAKTGWQIIQERNLGHVACTRAIDSFTYVDGQEKRKEA